MRAGENEAMSCASAAASAKPCSLRGRKLSSPSQCRFVPAWPWRTSNTSMSKSYAAEVHVRPTDPQDASDRSDCLGQIGQGVPPSTAASPGPTTDPPFDNALEGNDFVDFFGTSSL